MNIKRKLKGLTALLLATTVTLISPLTSLATSKGDIAHSAGGTDTDGVHNGKGGDFSVNVSDDLRISGKIGIRLSLVNRSNPSEVISVDENGKPRVGDCFLFFWKSSRQFDTLLI